MRDLLVPVIRRGERGERELCEREADVEDDQHAEQLADLARGDLGLLNEAAGEAVAVEHVEEDEDDLRHREQPVIGGAEDADDEEGRGPLHHLRENLAARTPDHRAANLCRERVRGAIRGVCDTGHTIRSSFASLHDALKPTDFCGFPKAAQQNCKKVFDEVRGRA